MFTALDENGKLINLLKMDKQEKQQLIHKRFYCPQCHEPLLVKNGTIKRIHFAHKTNGCTLSSSESEVHLLAKERLFNFFHDKNIFIEMERVFTTTNQRSDLFFQISKIGFVLEFQHSIISSEEIKERIENYEKNKLKQIWLIDPTLVKRTGLIIKLPSFLYEIIKQETFKTLRLFCPYEEKITIMHSILFLHSTKIIASEMTIPLKNSSISIFLSLNPPKKYNFQAFFQQIEKEKKNILYYYKPYQHFIFYLYENRIELVSTWWIGVPTSFNEDFDTSCVIWQGYLVTFWKKSQRFSFKESVEFMEELVHTRLVRIRSEEIRIITNAVKQYLEFLVTLNIISEENDIYLYPDSFFERNSNNLYKILGDIL